MINNELKKLREAHDMALMCLVKDNNVRCAVKGSVGELIVLMGLMMVDIHKDSGVALEELGKGLNEVVAKEIAISEKKK
jgi:hypothetical protein